jgi:hypothetical protein
MWNELGQFGIDRRQWKAVDTCVSRSIQNFANLEGETVHAETYTIRRISFESTDEVRTKDVHSERTKDVCKLISVLN